MSCHEELMNNRVHRLKDGQESCHAWIQESPAHLHSQKNMTKCHPFKLSKNLSPGCVVDA